VFGKKKTVNQEDQARYWTCATKQHKHETVPSKDGPIAEPDALFWKTDKTTAKAFLVSSPSVLLAIEAAHMSSATRETVESATIRLDDFLRNTGKRAYEVFWYPRPLNIIPELHKLDDYLTTDGK
jgi:hypothetical protein